MKKTCLALVALLLSACAPWSFIQPDIKGAPIKVTCDSGNSHEYLPGLDEKLYITSIDDEGTYNLLTLGPNWPESAEVGPGRHYLGLRYAHANSYADGKVWFDAEPGNEYLVRKAVKGYSVVFWVQDKSGKAVGGIPGSEPEKQVAIPPQAQAPAQAPAVPQAEVPPAQAPAPTSAEPAPPANGPPAAAAPAAAPVAASPAATAAPAANAATAQAWSAGQSVHVRAGAVVRASPTSAGAPVTLDASSGIVLKSPMRNAAGAWWYVSTGGKAGWVSESDLVP